MMNKTINETKTVDDLTEQAEQSCQCLVDLALFLNNLQQFIDVNFRKNVKNELQTEDISKNGIYYKNLDDNKFIVGTTGLELYFWYNDINGVASLEVNKMDDYLNIEHFIISYPQDMQYLVNIGLSEQVNLGNMIILQEKEQVSLAAINYFLLSVQTFIDKINLGTSIKIKDISDNTHHNLEQIL